MPTSLSDFDRFWAAYPRKVAKGQARRAFARLQAEGTLPEVEELVKAIEAAVQHGVFDRWQYSPHAATWLNAERWADEYGIQAPARQQVDPSGIVTHEQWKARRSR